MNTTPTVATVKIMFLDLEIKESLMGSTLETFEGKKYRLLSWDATKEVMTAIAKGFDKHKYLDIYNTLNDKFNNPAKPLHLCLDEKGYMYTVSDNGILSIILQHICYHEIFHIYHPRKNVMHTL